MKQLILVRHADFTHRNPMETDLDHPLTRVGRRHAAEVAEELLVTGVELDRILVSPAKRAIETAEILIKKMGLPADILKVEESIYQAERADMLHLVHQLDDSLQSVLIVGHNPGMNDLLNHLVDSQGKKMDTGSMATLELNNEFWRRVAFRTASFQSFFTPGTKQLAPEWWRRFTFWRRQKIQKVELFSVFLIGLVFIILVILLIVSLTWDPSAVPNTGSAAQ
jgi:phosphohistidine phosphatase